MWGNGGWWRGSDSLLGFHCFYYEKMWIPSLGFYKSQFSKFLYFCLSKLYSKRLVSYYFHYNLHIKDVFSAMNFCVFFSYFFFIEGSRFFSQSYSIFILNREKPGLQWPGCWWQSMCVQGDFIQTARKKVNFQDDYQYYWRFNSWGLQNLNQTPILQLPEWMIPGEIRLTLL